MQPGMDYQGQEAGVNSEVLPYIMGGCVCLTLLIVVVGGIGGMLFARNREKPAASAVPVSSEPTGASTAVNETAIAQVIPDNAPLADTMTSDLNATAMNKPVDDFTSDLKATLVHRPEKKEETDDNPGAV
jgi:hypothetical protein